MSDPQPEHLAPWAVVRADRPSTPTYSPDLEAAMAIAEERVVANAGVYLVVRVLGRTFPAAEWELETTGDEPDEAGPAAPDRVVTTTAGQIETVAQPFRAILENIEESLAPDPSRIYP